MVSSLDEALDLSEMPVMDTSLARNPRSGVWEIRWTDTVIKKDGTKGYRSRTYSCKTKNKKEAERVRFMWLRAGAHTDKVIKSPTVAGMIMLYRDGHLDMDGISPSQWDSLKPIGRLLGKMDLATLENPDIIAYRQARRREGVKDATIRRELGALRAAFGWCRRTGSIGKNFELPDFDLPPDSDPRKVFLEDGIERRVWDEVSALEDPKTGRLSRVARFVCLALAAPARSSTIEALTWDRVDLVGGWIDYRVPGKRITKKRQVPVPIGDRLRPILERARREAANPVDGYVLDHPGSTRKSWATLRKRLGLPDVWRHDLRRTWASLNTMAGVDMVQVAAVIGDTLATTTRHYAHLAPDHLRGAVNARQ